MYYVCTPNYDYETLVWCWEGLRLDVDIVDIGACARASSRAFERAP